ncbi:MAG TPA: hypothetical protein VFB08_01535 [Burkholderiales bacterium]|nr:hypothetical protein [Burkholderiales bacterium]
MRGGVVVISLGGKDRLAGNAGPRLERLLEYRMAEDDDAQRAPHPFALGPEELFPAESAHQVHERRVGALHDCAAFVEQRKQVA